MAEDEGESRVPNVSLGHSWESCMTNADPEFQVFDTKWNKKMGDLRPSPLSMFCLFHIMVLYRKMAKMELVMKRWCTRRMLSHVMYPIITNLV